MRTPTWEQTPGALAALFAERGPLILADAWTITLPSGQVLRYSGSDIPFSLGSRFFELGPGLRRNSIKWRVGITTDILNMTVTDNLGTTIAGQPLGAFVRGRGFSGAEVLLERAFWRPSDAGPVGALLWFLGEVDDADGDRYEATLTVSSFTKRLEVAVPRDTYQVQCRNQLFDWRCGLQESANTVTGAATSATTSYRTSFGVSIAKPEGWGTLGKLTMTSGANAGQTRTCKLHAGGQLLALQPWPFPVAVGDTFKLTAGCDRYDGTCATKFGNLQRFRGEPLIPDPAVAM